MIKDISIQNFRNILQFDFIPGIVNVIHGSSGTGKTSLLDAIALTDSSDYEFHAMIRQMYFEQSKTLTLYDLVHLNFFNHQQYLESFKIRLFFTNTRNRLFEIWKTDNGSAISAELGTSGNCPFLFVFDSIDPKQILPRVISYPKVDRVYQSLKHVTDRWPGHYVGPDRVTSISLLSKCYKSLQSRKSFWNSIQSFVNDFDNIESVGLFKHAGIDTIMVKTKDRQGIVPLYGCSYSMMRLLSIIIFLHSTNKSYFLIDDIEKGLSEEELKWLSSEIYSIAQNRSIQLFITTRRKDVLDRFKNYFVNKPEQMKTIEMSQVYKVEDLNGEPVR